MSHERGFRILKCIRVGFRARWAPRPLHTAPRHLQTTIFCSFACHLVWFVVDSWCILSKKRSQCDCSLVCVRECIFSITHGNIGNETNKWVGTRPTFLARWRGCRRQLDIKIYRWNLICKQQNRQNSFQHHFQQKMVGKPFTNFENLQIARF